MSMKYKVNSIERTVHNPVIIIPHVTDTLSSLHEFYCSLDYTNTLGRFEIVYLPKVLFWVDKQQEGHLWSIQYYVTKESEISECGFQTMLNKNIGIYLSLGFINVNGRYHVQFFHGSIIWHSFMLCQICGFLDYCFFRKFCFWHRHTNTQIEKGNIYIMKLSLFTSSMMIY